MAEYVNLDDMLEQFDKRASKLVDDKYYQPEYCPNCGAEMSEVVE